MFHSQAFKQAQIYAYNAPQHVWRPGSASPLAAIRWPTSKRIWLRGEIEDGSGGEGSGGEEKGEEGTRGRNFPPFWGQVYAHVETWHCPPSVHLRHLNAEERKDV